MKLTGNPHPPRVTPMQYAAFALGSKNQLRECINDLRTRANLGYEGTDFRDESARWILMIADEWEELMNHD